MTTTNYYKAICLAFLCARSWFAAPSCAARRPGGPTLHTWVRRWGQYRQWRNSRIETSERRVIKRSHFIFCTNSDASVTVVRSEVLVMIVFMWCLERSPEGVRRKRRRHNSKSDRTDQVLWSSEKLAGRSTRSSLPPWIHRTNAPRTPVNPWHGQKDDVRNTQISKSSSCSSQSYPGRIPASWRGRGHNRCMWSMGVGYLERSNRA